MGSTPIPSTDVLATRPVWLVSVLAGLAAAIATELYGLAARAVGIPMVAGNIGASVPGPITTGMFAMGTVTSVFWGTILAVLLARYSRRPARTYLWTTIALTAVSMAGPYLAGATAASTKVMLALAHIVAAAIVIPLVSSRLSHVPGRVDPAEAASGQG
ncbi:DUF6069 family protein [Micromonospora avicenniae]|uniref:Major facilitator superfamily (MFS) profile domain-containing protein n=1 Tax=Micromonospora avicenniae TaxID=1198245 RepID=A0A1N7EFT5_9ACTN|nr:DUF6069 family protein [Micromonospora avicenniae]SIR86775.1 hypothetical protein SAMN05444858_12316 [Micromonospora avicenniae]